MTTIIFFVFGMVIGSLVHIDGHKIKRNIDDYCVLSENTRAIGWYCIEKYLPADEKLMLQTITSCFGKTSFDQVMNLFCGLDDQERYNVILAHIHCFQGETMDTFSRGPTVDKENSSKCVSDRLPNKIQN